MKYNKDVPTNKISLLSKNKRQIQTIMVKVPNCARTPLLRKPKTTTSDSLEGSVCSISDQEEFEEKPKVFNMDKTILINDTDTKQKVCAKIIIFYKVRFCMRILIFTSFLSRWVWCIFHRLAVRHFCLKGSWVRRQTSFS